jgi:hypothetical protein
MNRDRFSNDTRRQVALVDLGHEPYRVFFPAGVAAGIAGVSLWPLYFAGATANYPGEAHARLMAFGLFGGFIFGFLGTALPRMLSAQPLGARNVFLLLTLHIAAAVAFAHQHIWLGNSLLPGRIERAQSLAGGRCQLDASRDGDSHQRRFLAANHRLALHLWRRPLDCGSAHLGRTCAAQTFHH